MSYPLYTIFGVLPSTIWLIFYLRKDKHPEPKKMVLKIFFYGMLCALPAIFLETGIIKGTLAIFPSKNLFIQLFNIFVGVALIEESLKYLVVRDKVLNHPEFDEPIDLVLYMIISALGFAALENILILFSLGPIFLLGETFSVSIFRFLGATLLHALASGTLGYFWAISIYEAKQKKYLFTGFFIATFLHGLYNFSIINIRGTVALLIPAFILLGLAIFLTSKFKRLKKIKSVCKID